MLRRLGLTRLAQKEAAWIERFSAQDLWDKARLDAMGVEVIASSPEEFRSAIGSEIQRWAKVVREANIKPE